MSELPPEVLRLSVRADGGVEIWHSDDRSAADMAEMLRDIAAGLDGGSGRRTDFVS